MELIIDEKAKSNDFKLGDIVVIKGGGGKPFKTLVSKVISDSYPYCLVDIEGMDIIWTGSKTLADLNRSMKESNDEYVIYSQLEYDLKLVKK